MYQDEIHAMIDGAAKIILFDRYKDIDYVIYKSFDVPILRVPFFQHNKGYSNA